MLKTVFFTMTYGSAIPILFPIAFLSFVNFYVTERIVLAYFHKKPPNFDLKINRRAISILRQAAYIGIFWSFLIFSNKEMF